MMRFTRVEELFELKQGVPTFYFLSPSRLPQHAIKSPWPTCGTTAWLPALSAWLQVQQVRLGSGGDLGPHSPEQQCRASPACPQHYPQDGGCGPRQGRGGLPPPLPLPRDSPEPWESQGGSSPRWAGLAWVDPRNLLAAPQELWTPG